MSMYEVVYMDDRDGHMVRVEVEADDEGEAIEIAQDEDYYYGKTIEVNRV